MPGFTLVTEEPQPEQNKGWVLVAPPGAGDNAATLRRQFHNAFASGASPRQPIVGYK